MEKTPQVDVGVQGYAVVVGKMATFFTMVVFCSGYWSDV